MDELAVDGGLTPLEIADRLEEHGYPHQAQKASSGDASLMGEAADWLVVEAGYVKRAAVSAELLGYSSSLREAARLEALLG